MSGDLAAGDHQVGVVFWVGKFKQLLLTEPVSTEQNGILSHIRYQSRVCSWHWKLETELES